MCRATRRGSAVRARVRDRREATSSPKAKWRGQPRVQALECTAEQGRKDGIAGGRRTPGAKGLTKLMNDLIASLTSEVHH